MKSDENLTKIASKNAQIALKHPKNEVLPFKIRFETDLRAYPPNIVLNMKQICSHRPKSVFTIYI